MKYYSSMLQEGALSRLAETGPRKKSTRQLWGFHTSQIWQKKQLLICYWIKIRSGIKPGTSGRLWKIKGNFPTQMKVLPIAEILHKSKSFRSILDVSFSLKLTPHGHVPSVNENNENTALRGAIDQIGHVKMRLIHAFTAAPDCEKIFQK